ncbi:unnamed protein product, partial [Urochloa humidicola]
PPHTLRTSPPAARNHLVGLPVSRGSLVRATPHPGRICLIVPAAVCLAVPLHHTAGRPESPRQP